MPYDDDEKKPTPHDEAFRNFSRTRQAEGGIKMQKRRGRTSGETWWGARWLALLESFDLGARLDRGRAYARKGQVLHIDVERGLVRAMVQGSRKDPYDVEIAIKVLPPEAWEALVKIFASQAIYAAKLLSRQMPYQVEDAFQAANASLFPQRESDLETACSCPDWSNPCKHIAAVYYLLSEEFDRDPFLIFLLRGLSEDDLLEGIDAQMRGSEQRQEPDPPPEPVAQPISQDHGKFWKRGALQTDLSGELLLPNVHALLVKRLGSFPFWRGEQDLWQTLEQIYAKASTNSVKRLDALSEGTSANEKPD